MNEKILVLDIDGTLTTSAKDISPETKKGLMMIQERGHIVMLASGRPSPGMMRYAKELELEKFGGYLLSFNGARIINCRTGEIVYQRTLPSFVIPGLYDFAKEHHCGLITYCGDYVVSGTGMDEYIELESRINGMRVRDVDDFVNFVNFDVNKCLMTAPPKEAEAYTKMLQEKYADTLSIYRSEPFFIEIMPKNVDKATSLERMLETVGLKKEDAICCGDGYNDITMIAYAGVGVAMANARDEVKAVADYVTKSNDEDGLLDVIHKFIM
ncbi:MAG: Cof-type HAD-IIB family hydrolase [Lachnospiraceae bacterium]|nr:Cof-type HAD-IIB family hydrolase [Lachnospiraceae bacterium]